MAACGVSNFYQWEIRIAKFEGNSYEPDVSQVRFKVQYSVVTVSSRIPVSNNKHRTQAKIWICRIDVEITLIILGSCFWWSPKSRSRAAKDGSGI